MRQISQKIPLGSCDVQRLLDSMDLSPSQQCVGLKVFKKNFSKLLNNWKKIPNAYVQCIVDKILLFSSYKNYMT